MPKKAGMEAWKKKRRQEHLEKKECQYYIFAKVNRQNHYILTDLSNILRIIQSIGIWY